MASDPPPVNPRPYGAEPPGVSWSGPGFYPPPPPAPPAPTVIPPGRRWHRFGALALGVALVAGAGAGAATSAVLSPAATTIAAVSPGVASTPLAASTHPSSTAAIVARIQPALVDIHTQGTSTTTSPFFGNGSNPFGGGQRSTQAAGTGMLLSSSGLVVTNAHVLEGATTISVNLSGQTANYPATLVGEDAAKDVALIQVHGVSGLPTVSMADSARAAVGEPVVAIGNALDLQAGGFTTSQGIISGLNRSIQTDNNESLTGLLQTSAAISSGDSGGPLANAAGQVIGMDTAAATSTSSNTASNIGFAIPANQITALVAQLQKGNVGAPTIGSSSSGAYGSNGGYGGYGYSSGRGGFG